MLKNYQEETLQALSEFLHDCAVSRDVSGAYSRATQNYFGRSGVYNSAGFDNIPYVCLRLPTGGGKTILAACSVKTACSEYLGRDFSLVVWLVPSTAILEQTYSCLQNSTHPYRRMLNENFDGNVEVLKIEDALSVSKGMLQSNTVIILSTFASWRVDKTEGRKVYESNGALTSHFSNIPESKKKELEHFENDNGKILKHSLANLVYLNNPLFIIDEAHNARTGLTFEVLRRLNPACILEFTATPKMKGPDRSNVVYNVSAARLKAENMIKMPIELKTSPEWQVAISDTVKKQQELELLAHGEESKTGRYLRPIVLIQAQMTDRKNLQ